MKTILLFIAIVLSYTTSLFAQEIPLSQLSSYYLPRILKMVNQDSVNFQIDTVNLKHLYSSQLDYLNEEKIRYDGMYHFDSFTLIQNASQFLESEMIDSLKNYREPILKAARHFWEHRTEQKYIQRNYGEHIITLAALVDPPLSLKDSLVEYPLPLKVRARLGDVAAEDSLLRDFKRTYHDTIFQGKPKINYVEQLLFVRSLRCINAINDMLSNNMYIYIRIDKPWIESYYKMPRWTVISSNTYILEEIGKYFFHDPARFFYKFAYEPLYRLPQKNKKGFLSHEHEVIRPYKKLGTQIYATVWEDYLSIKFDSKVVIDFKNLYAKLDCQRTPPPYLLKDSLFMVNLVCLLSIMPLPNDTSSYQTESEWRMTYQNNYPYAMKLLGRYYRDELFWDECIKW